MKNKMKLGVLGALAGLLLFAGIGSTKALAYDGIVPDLKADTTYTETTYHVYHAKVISPNDKGIETMSHHSINFTQLLKDVEEYKTVSSTKDLEWKLDNFGANSTTEVSRRVIYQDDARNHIKYGKNGLSAEDMEAILTEQLANKLPEEIKALFSTYNKVKIYRLVNEYDGLHVDLELVNEEGNSIPSELKLTYKYTSFDNKIPLPESIATSAKEIKPTEAHKGQKIDLSDIPSNKEIKVDQGKWMFDKWYVENKSIDENTYQIDKNTDFVGKWKFVKDEPITPGNPDNPGNPGTPDNPGNTPGNTPNTTPPENPGSTPIIEPITIPSDIPSNIPNPSNDIVNIVDEETPLSFPIDEEEAVLEDDVPLSEEVSIDDDATPLVDIPKTGDGSLPYLFTPIIISALSFFAFKVLGRVKE